MPRRKGKERKDRMLLIRVSSEEAQMFHNYAKEKKVSMSAFIRNLLLDSRKRKKKLDTLKIVAQKYESILEKFRRLYTEYKKY